MFSIKLLFVDNTNANNNYDNINNAKVKIIYKKKKNIRIFFLKIMYYKKPFLIIINCFSFYLVL